MSETCVIQEEFASAHLYSQSKWSDEKNLQVFGKCFSEHGHGHNYLLEVGFAVGTEPGPMTAGELRRQVQKACALVDHKHLNFDVAEFKDVLPTTENLALYLSKKLQQLCPNDRISYIKLFENNNLWVELR